MEKETEKTRISIPFYNKKMNPKLHSQLRGKLPSPPLELGALKSTSQKGVLLANHHLYFAYALGAEVEFYLSIFHFLICFAPLEPLTIRSSNKIIPC